MPALYTFLRGPDGSHGRWYRSGTRRPIEWSWTDEDVWDMDVARQILEHRARQHANRCPAPRQKDATVNPKPVFYFCNLTGVINYGPLPSVGAQLIDCMDDAGIRCCRLTVEAMTELLRRRPDPAKAQAEIARQTQNAVAWEQATIKARAYYAKAQTDLERERANNAVGLDMVRSECANLRAQLDRADRTAAAWEAHAKTFDSAFRGIDGALDKLGAPSADTLAGRVRAVGAKLRDPDYLRAALARIDAKAEALTTPTHQRAEIDARISELEKNE